MHLGTGQTVPRGRTGPRIGAYAVDVVIGALLWAAFFAVPLVVLALASARPSDGAAVALLLGSFVAAVMVYGLLYGLRRPLGQVIFGLRTVRTSDGGRVGAWRGMLRMLGGALLVPGIPIIVIGMVTSGSAFTLVNPPRCAVVSTR